VKIDKKYEIILGHTDNGVIGFCYTINGRK
jgi:hypothetical protein